MSSPIGAAEMAAIMRDVTDLCLPGTTDPPDGSTFEITAPATGQRFRVTVQEIPAWTPQMDRELEEITKE